MKTVKHVRALLKNFHADGILTDQIHCIISKKGLSGTAYGFDRDYEARLAIETGRYSNGTECADNYKIIETWLNGEPLLDTETQDGKEKKEPQISEAHEKALVLKAAVFSIVDVLQQADNYHEGRIIDKLSSMLDVEARNTGDDYRRRILIALQGVLGTG